jgi:hypothetical protein
MSGWTGLQSHTFLAWRAVATPLPKRCRLPLSSHRLTGISGDDWLYKFAPSFALLARNVAHRSKVSPTPLGGFESRPLGAE